MNRIEITACHSRAVITSARRFISSFASRANSHTFSRYRVDSHDLLLNCHILAFGSWAILPLTGWTLSPGDSCMSLKFWRLTHGINGIPHSLPNCHENYWDPPISSLTGGWDSPILTRGLWDSPCPSLPFPEGLFRFLSYPFRNRLNFHLSFHHCCATAVAGST